MKTILQFLGFRSNCCNAKIIDWHFDKQYCEACEQWLNISSNNQAMIQQAIKPRPVN